ncbi:MAG: DUF2007 domain-containing protein [Planctomycetes bacterium]|nr:DUF2007 domain-containing protein [Planctomycetota bacterium]
MSDKLVTVAKFYTAFEAEIAKLELDNNGINSIIVGGGLATMLPHIECVKAEIKVAEADVENAKAILDSVGEDSEGDV